MREQYELFWNPVDPGAQPSRQAEHATITIQHRGFPTALKKSKRTVSGDLSKPAQSVPAAKTAVVTEPQP